MINILHVVYSFDIGGLENGLINIINTLPDDKFFHHVCILSSGKKCLKRLNKKVKIHELHKREGNDFSLPIRIASIVRKEKIDIVHSRNWVALLESTLGCLLSGCKLVHSEHGKEIEDTFKQPFRRNLAKRFCYRFAKRIVTVSNSLFDEMLNSSLCVSSKLLCIINGVDTEKFNYNTFDEKIRYRIKYGLPEAGFIVGSVGRLAKIKNYEMMISICHELKDKNCYFVIAGEGPEREKIEKDIRQRKISDKFILLGEQNQISEVLGTYDLYLNTSHYEGISNTILEAMAKGLPVVANSIGGNREIVKNNKTGYLIENGKLTQYLKEIEQLKGDRELRELLSYGAREYVQRNFSLNQMVAKYENVYRSLL